MMPKLARKEANEALGRLDRIAHNIQAHHEEWGMPFEAAKAMVNDIDKTADAIEVASFGQESFLRRQAEVIQRDPDESYMDTFKNPMAPVQTESDEPYMKAYGDDQSSAVNHGQSSTGRKLAP